MTRDARHQGDAGETLFLIVIHEDLISASTVK